MPRPTSGTTIQRQDLAGPLFEYDIAAVGFIGLQAMPLFRVDKQSADYPMIPTEALLKMPIVDRAPRSDYNRGDWEFETDTYACVEHGWEEVIDDVEERLYARFFDAEQVGAQRAYDIILRAQEKRVADILFNATNFTANAVTNEWDDATNATPLVDVKAGKLAIRNATGLDPDTLIVSYSTYLDLQIADEVIDRIKYVFPGVVRGNLGADLLAQYFGVQRLLVGGARYDSAKEGQSQSLANLWSNEYAMLCVTNSGSSITAPCVGRTFLWTEDSPDNTVVESYYEDKVRGEVIRVRQYTDEELILTACAYLLSNITT